MITHYALERGVDPDQLMENPRSTNGAPSVDPGHIMVNVQLCRAEISLGLRAEISLAGNRWWACWA